MKHFSFFLLATALLFACKSPSNSAGGNVSDEMAHPGDGKRLSVAFYNVENLFDTEDNPDKIDEEFLPEGLYKWTDQIYHQKLENLARAIGQLGDADGPEILGLAEVENRKVVEDLVHLTSLKGRNYAVVHEESPDMRGIDVALVYDPKVFRYQRHQNLLVDFPDEPDYTSRDILLVEGKVRGETLYVLVNHWPSRRGGEAESEARRLRAAAVARAAVDSLFSLNPDADIVLMGDFNDDPHNKSMTESMQASGVKASVASRGFFNPMASLHDPETTGTLTYQRKWNLFDQFLVSKHLLSAPKLHYVEGSAAIFNPVFLQVGFGSAKDAPRRAIFKNEFQPEGFSDHFPVYLQLQVK
jgi:predicted extracellular nuclease